MIKSLFTFFLFITVSASAQRETNIYFDFNKDNINKEAERILNLVAADKTITAIEIFGNTDQFGTKDYNYKLSQRRADAVKSFLVSLGVDSAIVKTVQSYGEDRLAIERLDEQSRQMNRRVTVVTFYNKRPATAKQPPVQVPANPNKTQGQPPTTQAPSHTRPQKEKLLEELQDTSTKAGQTILLKNINFYGGSHKFLPIAYEPLEELLEAMQQIPTLQIEIQGHICCVEGEEDGWDNDTGEPFLSFNRARAVYAFLLRRGIDKNRMTYKGFGHRFPIFKFEKSDQERTVNRRVEIKIVKK